MLKIIFFSFILIFISFQPFIFIFFSIHFSSFDQRAKPDGLPKRAFSARGDFSGCPAKSDRSVSLSHPEAPHRWAGGIENLMNNGTIRNQKPTLCIWMYLVYFGSDSLRSLPKGKYTHQFFGRNCVDSFLTC
jgi:hypothetical protein